MHNKGSRTIAPGENPPPPNASSKANPKPNPTTNRGGGAIFFGGSCPDTHNKIFNKTRFVSQFRNK